MLPILRCHVLFMESVAACETSHVIKPVYRPWRHHRFKFFLWHHSAPPLDLGLPTPVCYAFYQSLVTALLQIKCLCGDFQVQETWCSPLVHQFGSQASCCAASSASSCSLQVTNRILFLGCRPGCLLFVPLPPKPMLTASDVLSCLLMILGIYRAITEPINTTISAERQLGQLVCTNLHLKQKVTV